MPRWPVLLLVLLLGACAPRVDEERSTEDLAQPPVESTVSEESPSAAPTTIAPPPSPDPAVPGARGQSLSAAKRAIRSKGLRIAPIKYEYSQAPSGTVLRQDPPPGVEVPVGTRVTLVVSMGPSPAPPTTEAPPPPPPEPACDPNYQGACLDPDSPDYDCAGGSGNGPDYVSGPVYIVGSDPHGLDSDGDGVGCE